MLAALKESTEEKELINLATAYLRGRKGTLVRKKKEEDAKRQAETTKGGEGVGGPGLTSDQANDGGASTAFSGISEQVNFNGETSTISISGGGDAMQLD